VNEGFGLVWELSTTYFTPALAVLLLAIAGVYSKHKAWVNAGFFVGSGLFLAVGEVISIAVTGQTISATHWGIDTLSPEDGLVLNLLIGSLFLILTVHLAKITIKRKK
jgi:hypothetical protein